MTLFELLPLLGKIGRTFDEQTLACGRPFLFGHVSSGIPVMEAAREYEWECHHVLSQGSSTLSPGPLVCAPLGLVRPMTIRAMMTRPITSCVKVASDDLQTAKFLRSEDVRSPGSRSCRHLIGVVYRTWPISLCFFWRAC